MDGEELFEAVTQALRDNMASEQHENVQKTQPHTENPQEGMTRGTGACFARMHGRTTCQQ